MERSKNKSSTKDFRFHNQHTLHSRLSQRSGRRALVCSDSRFYNQRNIDHIGCFRNDEKVANFTTMAKDQETDEGVQKLSNSPSTSVLLEYIQFCKNSLFRNVSTGVARPVFPSLWRRRVFNAAHGLLHPSVRATRQQLTRKFVWPSKASVLATWTRSCIACQQS